MNRKELFNAVMRNDLRLGLGRKATIKKGVLVVFSWALQPILPRPLYWLLKKTIVPVITTYMTVKLNRAAINHVANKQGAKLKRAVTDDEFKKAFFDLASV